MFKTMNIHFNEGRKYCRMVLQNAALGAFCNTFHGHYAIIGIENQFSSSWEWSFYTGFTVVRITDAQIIQYVQSFLYPEKIEDFSRKCKIPHQTFTWTVFVHAKILWILMKMWNSDFALK